LYGNYGGVDNVLTADESSDEEPTSDEPSEVADEEADEQPSTDDAAADSEANESDLTETTPAIGPEQIAAANQLVANSKNDPPKETAFLPLGVFSLAPQGQTEASALVQLAVSKTGLIRGTYYDLLTDHDQPIRGSVDKKTQQVAFSFGENGKVTFETALANLTQNSGAIAAHFENGKSTIWTLARYEKEPTAENESEPEAKAVREIQNRATTTEPTSESGVK
jgi:hypothetical protein